MDPWERQRVLARTTVVWAAASIGVGAAPALRPDPWWRAFGQQHIGWGAADLIIVGMVNVLERRRVGQIPDPYAPGAREQERRRLRAILVVNAFADAGYCLLGARLWRRRREPQAAGAGAAIVLQGGFLMVHDSYHAVRLRA